MLRLKVTYFLNPEGHAYFPEWYKEVFKEVAQQEGFIDMSCDVIGNTPTVLLTFTTQEKLDLWASLERHNDLFSKIESYFVEPMNVEILEKAEKLKDLPLRHN